MNEKRRIFLKLSVLAAAAAGTGAASFLLTRDPSGALQPWRDAGDLAQSDPRIRVLSWAVLAPNPHNLQPWLVRLDDNDGFTLFADTDRKLPETDPFDRQITIGLGCFLELARQAAASMDYALELALFPEGEPEQRLDTRPVARARLVRKEVTPDPLFTQVPYRRTCKEPFDLARPVAATSIDTLALSTVNGVHCSGSTDATETAKLRDLGWRAHLVEMRTKRTLKESIELMRIGKAEIEANPDGIDLGGAMMDLLKLGGLLTREQLADPDSQAYAQGLAMYAQIFEDTPAFMWLTTSTNTRAAQVRAGHAWVRMNLAATAQGLSLHPVSQSLQEYVEMADLFTEVHTLLKVPQGHRIQMLGRVGYGPSVKPSPRWPVHTRLMS